MKRLILVLAAMAASFAVASPAFAYPPGVVELAVSSEAPTPGSSITLTTDGFCGGALVTFTISPGGVIGTDTADGSGLATITVAAPSTPGSYTVTATAAGCPSYYATVNITVASGGGGGLPSTGSDSSPTLTLALIAVLVGVALVGVGAMRRRATTSV